MLNRMSRIWVRYMSVIATQTALISAGGAAAGPVVSTPPSDAQPPGLPIGRMDCLYHSALSIPRANTIAS
jgi:hypothetical protein